MKTANILFPIAFLLMSYFMVTEKEFLVNISNRDIFFHLLFVVAAIMMLVYSVIDLKKLKNIRFKKKIGVTFYLFSSLLFLLATVFALIAY